MSAVTVFASQYDHILAGIQRHIIFQIMNILATVTLERYPLPLKTMLEMPIGTHVAVNVEPVNE